MASPYTSITTQRFKTRRIDVLLRPEMKSLLRRQAPVFIEHRRLNLVHSPEITTLWLRQYDNDMQSIDQDTALVTEPTDQMGRGGLRYCDTIKACQRNPVRDYTPTGLNAQAGKFYHRNTTLFLMDNSKEPVCC